MAQRSLRDALLNAAASEFHEKGYSATGVAGIAARAGAPKGSFYNHFPSKDDLGVLVVEAYARSRRAEILMEPGADPIDALRRHFTWLRDDLGGDEYTRGCLLGNFGGEVGRTGTKVDDAVRESFDQWFAAITYAVRRAAEENLLPEGTDPDAAARFLGSSWEGAVLLAKVTGSPAPVEDFLAIAFPRVLGHPFAVPPA
ncbi:TetR family transcriptional regulator [Actinoplanes sp. TBRC 11911]|uniref:TetR/AcrR family transcriptional regulator n=1 Tax=Actinoplanes sp. TBRC 11911 TaxID=2729386 RepID=UPI00145CCF0C|nr:TetR/AcrR family transcriptional regulator [Actinoplanes sp. TBRC 11911]NMO56605.1 TetR family transcriptional regulator [Actinoplanes sp. TBRC 11911]